MRRRATGTPSPRLFASWRQGRERYGSVFPPCFSACAVCLSLRAAFRVCHDLLSVFGFGFNFLCDVRVFGVVVAAMYAPSAYSAAHSLQRQPAQKRRPARTTARKLTA